MSHRWITGGLRFLESCYDQHTGLFSYSSQLIGQRITNDFRHPGVVRYTINSLLGLQEAAHWQHSGAIETYGRKLETFLSRRWDDVEDWGDQGLLLVLLARERRRDEAREVLKRFARFSEAPTANRVDLQSVSWMLWGAASAAQAGFADAATVARKLFRILNSQYIDRDSLLARHNQHRHRRRIVSFGGTVYYLRALYEYGTALDDEYALTIFDWAVRRIIALQGPLGEWPWMIHVRSARLFDPYPVFSVHQDSMAMLFLIPALERGIDAKSVISRSCLWVEGRNELSTSMIVEEPYFVYRSIQRTERAPKLRRYFRSFAPAVGGWPTASKHGVEINRECRSYHIGWILFVWSGRRELLESSLSPAASAG